MTVLPPDPYRILGVLKDAQIAEIRSAYRKLVLKCHPDKIQDPALKEAKQIEFQQVQQAYELLSNDFEREKYDYKVELNERERELRVRSTVKTSTSAPKEPVYYNVNVKDASPRTTTFTSTRSGPYPGGAPSRSWEDTTAGARLYDEPPRSARKTASYEKDKPAKRDDERRRRKEDEEWAYNKEKEKEKTKDREAREAARRKDRKEEEKRLAREREREREEREKEKRKEEKKKATAASDREKERAKERKSTTAEKHHSKPARIIPESSDSSDSSDDDAVHEAHPSKAERKKSSNGHKAEEVEPPSSERTRKYSGNMESAIRYLTRSGAKPPAGFTRAQTFTEGSSKLYAVPTPPPAANTAFPPPPPPVKEPEELSDDDVAKRSSARPTRRMSHDTPRSSKEKTSHKKSSTSREQQPVIIDAGPPRAVPPSMSRAQTENFSARPINIPPGGPSLNRAETWYPSTEHEHKRHERPERSRSRQTPPIFSENDDSDNDRKHRRRNRRTGSPEPMVSVSQRYAVDGTKSYPIRQKSYHEQPSRSSYKAKGGSVHVVPNSSAPRLPRHATYAARGFYDEAERPQQFSNVKYAAQFDANDVKYSYRSPDVYT